MGTAKAWSVKGVDPRLQARAEGLARVSGLSVGEWLARRIDDDASQGPEAGAEPGGDVQEVAAPFNHQRPAGSTKIEPGPARLDPERFSPENRRRLSAPGLRAFVAIADLWGLNETERRLVLGLPSRSTYHNWVRIAREHGAVTLDVDGLTRISAVLGIHQALGVLFGSEAEGVAWLRRPHGGLPFGGRPPLELLTSGTQDGLMTVRRFLDAARGGLYMAPGEIDRDFLPYTDDEIVFS